MLMARFRERIGFVFASVIVSNDLFRGHDDARPGRFLQQGGILDFILARRPVVHDLRSGQPYWMLKNGLLASYPALHRDEKCEIAIIGGGIIGALTALRLAEVGVNVVLLDARDVATGSTAASTSLLQYEIDAELVDLVDRLGEAGATRVYRLGLEAIDWIEELVHRLPDRCGFQRQKSLYLASKSAHVSRLQREFECRRRLGFAVDYLDAKAVAEHYPFTAPGAILSAGDAAIDAFRLTHFVLAAAARMGARIYDRTKVTAVRRQAEGFCLETDRSATVASKRLVFATGYESGDFLRTDAGTLTSTFAAISEPYEEFPHWPDRCHIWETARPYFYIRCTSDNRIVIGGEDVPFATAHRQTGMIARKTERLVRRFEKMFPGVGFEVAYAWAGTFGETEDGLAYVGESPEWPGAYFALGYGGNGITMSVIAARLIADNYRGVPNGDAVLFRFDR
jgi:glycine/D-amino acid oxidase-like deaminating enzyme